MDELKPCDLRTKSGNCIIGCQPCKNVDVETCACIRKAYDGGYGDGMLAADRRAAPEIRALTLEQVKQLKPGDTVTILHSGRIRRIDGESFETQSSMWGYGDVADGTVRVYARKPEGSETP
jgi:hypothetical protein